MNIQTSKRIGRGAFTTAYLTIEGKVLLKSTCPLKECYSLFLQDNPLIAKIETAGYCNRTDKPLFLMDYLAPSRSLRRELKQDQYDLYKKLVAIFKTEFVGSYQNIRNAIESLDVDQKVLIDLLDIVDSCSNYANESLCFEISPRNVRAVDGNLILLDCFFCRDTLLSIRR